MTGSKSKLTFLPLPQDDPKQRQPNIALAREKLGWEPTVPLREGLRHTIAYFDRLLSEGGNEAPALSRAHSSPPARIVLRSLPKERAG